MPAMAHRVTLIPGDGIGPELAEATKRVLDASGVEFEWEVVEAGEAVLAREGTPLPQSVLDSIIRNKVAIKGPITTPVGVGFRSVNVALRQILGLYANVRPVRSIPGLVTRYDNVDLVIVRENTEDLYAGIEHMVGPDAAESIKIITRAASERIARYAFEYAVANGRSKVTAVHKANIMKFSDGLFLESCRTIAALYEGRIAFGGPHRQQDVHAARQEAGPIRRAGPAEPVRRHRQRPVRGPRGRSGCGARGEHRPRLRRLRSGPRLRPQVRGAEQSEPHSAYALWRPAAAPHRRASRREAGRGRRPSGHRRGPHSHLRSRRGRRDEGIRRRDRRPPRLNSRSTLSGRQHAAPLPRLRGDGGLGFPSNLGYRHLVFRDAPRPGHLPRGRQPGRLQRHPEVLRQHAGTNPGGSAWRRSPVPRPQRHPHPAHGLLAATHAVPQADLVRELGDLRRAGPAGRLHHHASGARVVGEATRWRCIREPDDLDRRAAASSYSRGTTCDSRAWRSSSSP